MKLFYTETDRKTNRNIEDNRLHAICLETYTMITKIL